MVRGSRLRPPSRMSPTTPMIWRAGSSNSEPTPLPMRICWPMGLPLGQYRLAIVSLMVRTPAAPVVSCVLKSRPWRRGILKTEK